MRDSDESGEMSGNFAGLGLCIVKCIAKVVCHAPTNAQVPDRPKLKIDRGWIYTTLCP